MRKVEDAPSKRRRVTGPAGEAMRILDKADFKGIIVHRDQARFTMINGSICQGENQLQPRLHLTAAPQRYLNPKQK